MTTPMCSTHLEHRPANQTVELHHVVPQAWQATWRPPAITGPGGVKMVLSTTGIWDPRTVPLCPTGHRNVHHWLVLLMHGIAGELTRSQPDEWQAFAAATRRMGHHLAEQRIADLGVTRWLDAGGQLATLIAAREWGEA